MWALAQPRRSQAKMEKPGSIFVLVERQLMSRHPALTLQTGISSANANARSRFTLHMNAQGPPPAPSITIHTALLLASFFNYSLSNTISIYNPTYKYIKK